MNRLPCWTGHDRPVKIVFDVCERVRSTVAVASEDFSSVGELQPETFNRCCDLEVRPSIRLHYNSTIA